jgi:hypothetical protein
MDTHIIELAAMKLDHGYVYTYHWIRYNMHHSRYEAIRILWAAHCLLQNMEVVA